MGKYGKRYFEFHVRNNETEEFGVPCGTDSYFPFQDERRNWEWNLRTNEMKAHIKYMKEKYKEVKVKDVLIRSFLDEKYYGFTKLIEV